MKEHTEHGLVASYKSAIVNALNDKQAQIKEIKTKMKSVVKIHTPDNCTIDYDELCLHTKYHKLVGEFNALSKVRSQLVKILRNDMKKYKWNV